MSAFYPKQSVLYPRQENQNLQELSSCAFDFMKATHIFRRMNPLTTGFYQAQEAVAVISQAMQLCLPVFDRMDS